MTFKVFISSSLEDIHLVNELKETLERYGILPILPMEMAELKQYIEGARPYRPSKEDLTPMIMQQIQTSDCVLVIVGRGGKRSEFVDFETGVATAQNKLIIPIVEEGAEIPKTLANKEYILIDRNQPRLSYERAAQYLNKLKIEKERRNAIGGLLLLGLGFLLLAALVSD